MDDRKLIETFSRRQISRLDASENREYRPAELLQLPLLWPSASLPIVDCRPRTSPLVSCHIPRPRKGDHGLC
jgi:hypothetical protein